MTSAPSRRAPAPSIDIQVQSPLWQAEPAAEQTVRAPSPRPPRRSQQRTAKWLSC